MKKEEFEKLSVKAQLDGLIEKVGSYEVIARITKQLGDAPMRKLISVISYDLIDNDENDKVIILPEVQKTLKLGDFSNYGKELSNYTSGNIEYWLNEIARNHTSNNYMDCLEWLKDFHNVSAFELAIEQEKITIENFDLYTAILAAQRIQTFDDLKYNKDAILLNYAIDYLMNVELIEELDAKTFNLIKESIKVCDSLEELREKINTILDDGEVITINIHQ